MFSFKAKILFQKNHFGIKRGGGRTSANVEDISQTKSNNNKKQKVIITKKKKGQKI